MFLFNRGIQNPCRENGYIFCKGKSLLIGVPGVVGGDSVVAVWSNR